MNKEDLAELFKPCEKLCMECGSECCYNPDGTPCERLKEGRCIQRREYCMMIYCDKIEQKFPEVVRKLKEEVAKMYPESIKRGVTPNYKWSPKKKK